MCSGFRFSAKYRKFVVHRIRLPFQNTLNSIEQFTDDTFSGEIDEKTGSLAVLFPHGVGKDSRLLLDSMVLGLTSIAEEYGKKYIKIRFREV